MQQDRRIFLKTTGIAGAAALGGAAMLSGLAPTAARAAAKAAGEPLELPKGMTFATLRRVDGYGLGLRTERGILDVVAAEKEFGAGAPTTITAVFKGEGDVAALRRLVDSAKTSASPDRFFVAEDKASFGPCVTEPEKIVCIGLNYRKHAAETGNPAPKQPILFNKYNSALNCCGGSIAVSKEKAEKFDYEAELVIVIGRTARNVSEADAPRYIFGYCTGNDFTARDLQFALEPVDDRKDARWLGLDRSLASDGRSGRRRQSQDRMPGERRGAPVVEHVGYDLQLQTARELRVRLHDAQAGRHHLHRNPRGSDQWLSERETGLAEDRRPHRQLDREAWRSAFHADLTRR
jgi:hypothetical protein